MQPDDLIWKLIGDGFCSFKTEFDHAKFCRNEYNVSGLCKPECCPLSNSRYATIKQIENRCYLYIKTAERSKMPTKMWERIKLPKDYEKALDQIDKNLLYWPEYMIHKCKQRYTVIYQVGPFILYKYLLRKRKVILNSTKNLVPVRKTIDRREASREAKALKNARIERSIQSSLIEQLKDGKYNDIYNFDKDLFKQIIGQDDQDESVDENQVITEYVEDTELDKHILKDIEEPPSRPVGKKKMVMNVQHSKRSRDKL